jgi:hypothetical protein
MDQPEPRPCTEKFITASGFKFVCIRPYHGGDHVYVDRYRRSRGEVPSADHHVFVREEKEDGSA